MTRPRPSPRPPVVRESDGSDRVRHFIDQPQQPVERRMIYLFIGFLCGLAGGVFIVTLLIEAGVL